MNSNRESVYSLYNNDSYSNKNHNWDCIVITASNFNQAQSFVKQIEYRKTNNIINKKINFMVVADDNDKRIGSGGSTLSVIKKLKEKYKDLSNKKFLLIHAGGDSKRCPQYSAIGKLFSPIPCSIENNPATLFDVLISSVMPLASRIQNGMLLLSGDVFPLFDVSNCEIKNDKAFAISFKENKETAKNHGVYLEDDNGYVKRFLHKLDTETLVNVGAVDDNGDCNIDTGIIYLCTELLNKLEELVHNETDYKNIINDKIRLSLYGDIEYCLANASSLDNYYSQAPEGNYCDELIIVRTKLWNKISSYNIKLIKVPNGKFIHFGTIKEVLSLMNSNIDKYEKLNWSRNVFVLGQNNVSAYNSIIDKNCNIGMCSYIENSYIHNGTVIGNNCYISSSEIENVVIPDNLLVHCIKQNNGKYICRMIGINDNPKENKIFGLDIDDLINKHQLKNVFNVDKHSLWDANLFIESDSIKEAIESSLYVYKLLNGSDNAKAFNESNRKSLCSGFNDADISSVIEWNNGLIRINKLNEYIITNKSASYTKRLFNSKELSKIESKWVDEKAKDFNISRLYDFSYLMRLYYYIGYALNNNEYTEKCFKLISDVIVNNSLNKIKYNDNCKIVNDDVFIEMPLRVNFGGGWSDTPPHCIEHGGKVINAAIKLNGQFPVKVKLTKIKERKIVFESKDLNAHIDYEQIEKLQEVGDASDWSVIYKACLLACGIIPKKGEKLNSLLNRFGGGFVMSTNVVDVPKGSGLGTSSILAAACIKSIFEFFGIVYDENTICSTVLSAEQIMSTGGGWQDQVGGLTNGVKYLISNQGIDQSITIEHLDLSDKIKKEFNDRYCVIYSGKQRLAKNILRDVVGRYIGNIEESLDAHKKIQEVAIRMKNALLNDDFDEFARLLDYHWFLSKQIDSDSTNDDIERIFDSIKELIDARMIIGAGGGGFIQVILKKGVSKMDIQEHINKSINDISIKVYDSSIVW